MLRRRMMIQSGEPIPTEYIQDGLVFWLDAEDFNGSNWVDRFGNFTFTKNGGGIVKRYNSIFIPKGSNLITPNANFNLDKYTHTIEFAGKGLMGWCFLSGKDSINIAVSQRLNYAHTAWGCFAYNLPISYTDVKYFYVEPNNIAIVNSEIKCIKNNNVEFRAAYKYVRIGGDIDMEVCAIRIYNRPLTKIERANNRNLDKIRFGL